MKTKIKKLTLELLSEIKNNRVIDGAAVIAFFATLATFPALIALIALLTVLPIEGLQKFIFDFVGSTVPGDSGNLIKEIISDILHEKQSTIASFGFLGTLWTASSGMVAVIEQLNFAYNIKKTRSYIKQRTLALALTIFYITMMIIASAVILTGSKLLHYAGVHDLALLGQDSFILDVVRYTIVYSILLFCFASIYFLAPNSTQKFKYVTPGSIFGSTIIILSTLGFDYYISNFANYNKTYGSLGGIIVYMLWIYISGFVLLLSAEINGVLQKFEVFDK